MTAYRLAKEIRADNKIATEECDVFEEEFLNYFFVGRPAYKLEGTNATPAEWELPCCFIFEYQSIKCIKRIFPFDTGAHHLERYPNYINMMKREEFDVGGINDAAGRIIGAFFGSARAYFELDPKSTKEFKAEFDLGALDAEVLAVHRLAGDNRDEAAFDDRRLTIEVQSDEAVDLIATKPLAVILPTVYLDDPRVREAIVDRWGAEPLTYNVSSLSVKHYYGVIYEKVLKFYQDNKFL